MEDKGYALLTEVQMVTALMHYTSVSPKKTAVVVLTWDKVGVMSVQDVPFTEKVSSCCLI